jgi:predicted RNA-binding Zn-ribbon protein involved in translation (DUF1610 family)
MTTMQQLINKAVSFGLAPFLVPGKKLIMTFTCPKCGRKNMIKFIKKPDYRNKIWACKDCGFRKMSKGWVKNHGPFLTGTLAEPVKK